MAVADGRRGAPAAIGHVIDQHAPMCCRVGRAMAKVAGIFDPAGSVLRRQLDVVDYGIVRIARHPVRR